MKYKLLILWMLLTICLVITIVGMLLFVPDGYGGKSSWFLFGHKLLDSAF